MSESNPFYGETFADRKIIREAGSKQVDGEAEQVEDKAIKPAETKRTTRKKS